MELFSQASLSPEIIAEIRRLHFETSRLAEEGISGSYRSAFRGRGIEFEEVRPYRPGDDIRSIDWKVTARSGEPFVKIFREERELNVLIAVDVSASNLTGTRCQLREALLARVGAVLSLIALRNNDHVGLVTYSDKIETFHPPRKAKGAVWRILHDILAKFSEEKSSSQQNKTDLSGMFSFIQSVLKKKSVVFVLSDFADTGFEQALASLSRRHDVTAVLPTDPSDLNLPEFGLIDVCDPETGFNTTLDCSNELFRKAFHDKAQEHRNSQLELLLKNKVGIIELSTERPFMQDLQLFFNKRNKKS